MTGCGDSGCPFTIHRGGMATNGGCHCFDGVPSDVRVKLRKAVYALREERDALEEVYQAASRITPSTDGTAKLSKALTSALVQAVTTCATIKRVILSRV